MHTCLINLARDQDRLQAMAAQLDALQLPWVRVDAVYGRDLSPPQLAALYDAEANRRNYHQPLVAGEIGCYASHLAVWQRLLDEGRPMALVLEDDVQLSPALLPVLEALRRLPPRWDMVKLIGRAREPVLQQWPLTADAQLIRHRRVPSLTGAYVLSARGAQRLLSARRPFFRPIDVDLRYWWEAQLCIYGVQPYPVQHGEASHQSSIGTKARPPILQRWRKWTAQWSYSLSNVRANRALQAEGDPFR